MSWVSNSTGAGGYKRGLTFGVSSLALQLANCLASMSSKPQPAVFKHYIIPEDAVGNFNDLCHKYRLQIGEINFQRKISLCYMMYI